MTSHGEEDGWSWVFWPQHGEFANTTNFVVSENALDVLEFELAPRRIDEIALFTDGLENLVLHHGSKTVHDPFFNALLKPIRQSINDGYDESLSEKLTAYLGSPAFCERTDANFGNCLRGFIAVAQGRSWPNSANIALQVWGSNQG